MKATINGEPREIGSDATLASVLAELNVPEKGTAVAVNDRVVVKAEYGAYRLHDGDRVEIIVAVAGG